MEWIDEFDEEDLREITRKYLPDTVAWTTDWTTGSLLEQIEREVFDVDPPFQRRSAWDDKKASLYIESLLIGCPVPPVTLAELPKTSASPHQYIVIDGKQRLSSLKRFALDKSLKLTGLEVLPDLNGQTYSAVTASAEFERFSNIPIRTVVLRNWKKDEVLQFVFHRLNTQVTPLSTHELRRSLLAGPFTEYLDERSAKSTGVQRILGINEPDYRLRDAELWLRAISFCEFSGHYGGNLKLFLDSTTKSLNKTWGAATRAKVESLGRSIDDAIDATFAIFGTSAFQRVDSSGSPSNRFNRAIFDIMVFAFHFPDVREGALRKPEEVKDAFNTLSGNPVFETYISTTTKKPDAVFGRIGLWLSALGPVVGLPNLEDRAPRKAEVEKA
jgi:hypothetical protein